RGTTRRRRRPAGRRGHRAPSRSIGTSRVDLRRIALEGGLQMDAVDGTLRVHALDRVRIRRNPHLDYDPAGSSVVDRTRLVRVLGLHLIERASLLFGLELADGGFLDAGRVTIDEHRDDLLARDPVAPAIGGRRLQSRPGRAIRPNSVEPLL